MSTTEQKSNQSLVKSIWIGTIKTLIRILKWLPVLFAVFLFTWGWYAYTVIVVLGLIESHSKQISVIIISHIICFLALWSYFKTVTVSSKPVPNKFKLNEELTNEYKLAVSEQQKNRILLYVIEKNGLKVNCRTLWNSIRYCPKCNIVKPDRSHHCSICQRCILRMDHHCPWVNNCVSYENYKFFYLFLCYTTILCIFVSLTTLPNFLTLWKENSPLMSNSTSSNTTQSANQSIITSQHQASSYIVRLHTSLIFFITSTALFGLISLSCYHTYLIINNRSTLESMKSAVMSYGPDRKAFDLGLRENIAQVLGRNKYLWFLPIDNRESDGLSFNARVSFSNGEVRHGYTEIPPSHQTTITIADNEINPKNTTMV